MRFSLSAGTALLALATNASPVQPGDLETRNLTPTQCSKVYVIIEVLKLQKATSFCSSFLSIEPATSTSTVLVTFTTSEVKTATITAATASTSIIFAPGNPPAAKPKERREIAAIEERAAAPDPKPAAEAKAHTPTIPPYITAYATSAISSACQCLNLPTPTTTVTTSSVTTVTSTGTITATIYPPVVTSTVYRKSLHSSYPTPQNLPANHRPACATPVPSLTLNLPYGASNGANTGGNQNNLYGSETTGNSLEGCCNLCFFGVPNCVQAVYYSYEGCVIEQAVSPLGTGQGVSDVCPVGQIAGLTYNPDTNPPFRSTGLIAGPCGSVYNNLG